MLRYWWCKLYIDHLSMCCSIEAYIWLTFFVFLQSEIFLLNCDVCCSIPLPEMLGKLPNLWHYFLSFSHHRSIFIIVISMSRGSPKSMGIILVSKVSQFSLWNFLAEHRHFWFISYVHFSVSTCCGFGLCNWQVSMESTWVN